MRSRRLLLGLVPGVLLAGYAIALVLPVVSPYAWYPIHHLRCGGPPVIATRFAAAYVYLVPGDPGYRVDPLVTDFFCTEDEAQRAGFHRAA